MTIQQQHKKRMRYIRLADQDITRYRELRDAGKLFQTFLAGAAHFYKKAGLSKKARAVKRLLKYVQTRQAN